LDRAFGDRLNPEELEALKYASWYADQDQSLEGSFKHGMRFRSQSVAEAQAALRNYLCVQMRNARNAASRSDALFFLGMAMHALMDETSPSHAGFQIWRGMKKRYSMHNLIHVLGDSQIGWYESRAAVEAIRGYYEQYLK